MALLRAGEGTDLHLNLPFSLCVIRPILSYLSWQRQTPVTDSFQLYIILRANDRRSPSLERYLLVLIFN